MFLVKELFLIKKKPNYSEMYTVRRNEIKTWPNFDHPFFFLPPAAPAAAVKKVFRRFHRLPFGETRRDVNYQWNKLPRKEKRGFPFIAMINAKFSLYFQRLPIMLLFKSLLYCVPGFAKRESNTVAEIYAYYYFSVEFFFYSKRVRMKVFAMWYVFF